MPNLLTLNVKNIQNNIVACVFYFFKIFYFYVFSILDIKHLSYTCLIYVKCFICLLPYLHYYNQFINFFNNRCVTFFMFYVCGSPEAEVPVLTCVIAVNIHFLASFYFYFSFEFNNNNETEEGDVQDVELCAGCVQR